MVLQRYKNAILLLLAVVCLSVASDVRADYTEWNHNFDSYSTGNLNGQDGWVGDTDLDIESFEGGYAVRNELNGANEIDKINLYDLTNYDDYYVTATFQTYTNYTGNSTLSAHIEIMDSNGDDSCIFGIGTDSDYRVVPFVNGLGTIDVIDELVPTSTPVTVSVQLDNVNQRCRLFTSASTTEWTNFSSDYSGTSTTQLQIQITDIGSYGDVYVDNIFISGVNSGLTLGGVQCTTCTRIIEFWDPENGETLAGTTTAQDLDFTYFVSTDDFVQADTYVKYRIQHALYYPSAINQYIATVQEATQFVPQSGITTHFYSTLSKLLYTGTYNLQAEIYTEELIEAPWWNPFADDETVKTVLATKSLIFYVATATTQADYQYQEQENLFNQAQIDAVQDEGFKDYVDGIFNKLKYSPPFGYATLIADMWLATTSSTSALELTLTGTGTSPLAGHTLTLNLGDAIDDGIDTINAQGQMWDKFMDLWNLFWYVMLAFWIIREIFGGHGFTIKTEEKEKPIERSSSGNTHYKF